MELTGNEHTHLFPVWLQKLFRMQAAARTVFDVWCNFWTRMVVVTSATAVMLRPRKAMRAIRLQVPLLRIETSALLSRIDFGWRALAFFHLLISVLGDVFTWLRLGKEERGTGWRMGWSLVKSVVSSKAAILTQALKYLGGFVGLCMYNFAITLGVTEPMERMLWFFTVPVFVGVVALEILPGLANTYYHTRWFKTREGAQWQQQWVEYNRQLREARAASRRKTDGGP